MGAFYAAVFFLQPHGIAWRVASNYRSDMAKFRRQFKILDPIRIAICVVGMALFVGWNALQLVDFLSFFISASPIFVLGVVDYVRVLNIFNAD
jgi:hypothetical protein